MVRFLFHPLLNPAVASMGFSQPLLSPLRERIRVSGANQFWRLDFVIQRRTDGGDSGR